MSGKSLRIDLSHITGIRFGYFARILKASAALLSNKISITKYSLYITTHYSLPNGIVSLIELISSPI